MKRRSLFGLMVSLGILGVGLLPVQVQTLPTPTK